MIVACAYVLTVLVALIGIIRVPGIFEKRQNGHRTFSRSPKDIGNPSKKRECLINSLLRTSHVDKAMIEEEAAGSLEWPADQTDFKTIRIKVAEWA
jgi:hypothetical protein